MIWLVYYLFITVSCMLLILSYFVIFTFISNTRFMCCKNTGNRFQIRISRTVNFLTESPNTNTRNKVRAPRQGIFWVPLRNYQVRLGNNLPFRQAGQVMGFATLCWAVPGFLAVCISGVVDVMSIAYLGGSGGLVERLRGTVLRSRKDLKYQFSVVP